MRPFLTVLKGGRLRYEGTDHGSALSQLDHKAFDLTVNLSKHQVIIIENRGSKNYSARYAALSQTCGNASITRPRPAIVGSRDAET